MQSILAISGLGLVGILSRYGLDRVFATWWPTAVGNFPISTFLINILGSALAGVFIVAGPRESLSPEWQLGLLVGFCGGFTTFSAYALQTVQMAEQGRWVPAFSYWILSPTLGFLAAMAAVSVTRKF